MAKPRFHVEGQTSTVGLRWQIWDGVEGHFARYRNIADEGDAVAICEALNRLSASPPLMECVDALEEAMRAALAHRYGDWPGILEEALAKVRDAHG
jgi:hypothetical protein